MIETLAGPAAALATELRRAVREAGGPPDFEPTLERPPDPRHGDLASNAALVLAGRLKLPPRELAHRIARTIDPAAAGLSAVEVAGPGFLNFRLDDSLLWEGLRGILAADRAWGRSDSDSRRVNVEFVSTNPTGPLHVAHGRGAAVGDAVASLLEWTGCTVTREFYVNDAGRQIDLLGESVEARYRQERGGGAEVPESGYHGGYVTELARRIAAEEGASQLDALSAEKRTRLFARRASAILREEQAEDLEAFGVCMDRFSEESAFAGQSRLSALLERLQTADHAYRDGGAVWLRTSRFGDEKDRVLVKSDGSHTYFLTDIAYHLDKLERGYDLAIDVWGADHHGHVPRMRAALQALGAPSDFLEVVLIQLVTVFRGGEEVRMSKRAGEFVPLRELFEETGRDVARYFFLMRRSEAPLNFDLDLALDTSEANPVYKVQYAHARMCSVFGKGRVEPAAVTADPEVLARLDGESEREVTKILLRFPEVVRGAADARAPYQVCGYLEELAGAVNSWYHEGNMDPARRVLAEGPTRPARLALARAVQITLRNGLRLLGLRAPQRMIREGDRG
ncbi:MAG: arginine--tRNA ligase [Gemmatimonadota bacterium]